MSDDAVWQRLQELAPVCDCGQRFQLGGTRALGPMLVCPPCSLVAAPDPGWLSDVIAQARADVQAASS